MCFWLFYLNKLQWLSLLVITLRLFISELIFFQTLKIHQNYIFHSIASKLVEHISNKSDYKNMLITQNPIFGLFNVYDMRCHICCKKVRLRVLCFRVVWRERNPPAYLQDEILSVKRQLSHRQESNIVIKISFECQVLQPACSPPRMLRWYMIEIYAYECKALWACWKIWKKAKLYEN